MGREELDKLYDLLDDFYYAYEKDIMEKIFIDFVSEKECTTIYFSEILIALQEKIQEKLAINTCWNIKK